MRIADLAIIGAGPAGMAAAIEASQRGLRVVVLDERAECGGHVLGGLNHWGERLGSTLTPFENGALVGRELIGAFQESRVDYRPDCRVWCVDPDNLEVHYAYLERTMSLRARRLLIATGGRERPVAFPGWTLPGVIGLGAAQDRLRYSPESLPESVILAGTGPLLYVLANQMLAAGRQVRAILDTRRSFAPGRAVLGIMTIRNAPERLYDAVRLWRQLKRRGIPIIAGIRELKAEGSERVRRILYRSGRKTVPMDCDLLVAHWDVIPDIDLTGQAGLAHAWHPGQNSWWPQLDPWGNGNRTGIMVAGDSGGIFGLDAARHSGRIAALDAAHSLGLTAEEERNIAAAFPWGERDRLRALRPIIDGYFPAPRAWMKDFADDVPICPCVNATAADIRAARSLGATGPNQVKALCGAGGGACRGRICGSIIAEFLAVQAGLPPYQIERLNPPLPARDITLNALAEGNRGDQATD